MGIKRYYAFELGRLTTGYDPEHGVTLIRRWSLAATGPDDLSVPGLGGEALRVLEEALRSSAEQATYEAAMAAYAVPGEFTARLAVAWEVFWQRFPMLVQAKAEKAAEQFVGSFSIGIFEDVLSEDGLILDATAGKATAQMYAKLYDAVGQVFTGDLGKAVGQYCALLNQYNELLSIDIHLEAPREVTHAIAEAANATKKLAEVEKALEDLPQRIVDFTEQFKEYQQKLDDALGGAGAKVEENIAAVALQVGGVARNVAEQLKGAGALVENLPARLETLTAGLPRLDLQAAGEFGKSLEVQADRIYKDIGNKLSAEVQGSLQRLEDVRRELEQAIGARARQLVVDLQAKFQLFSKDYDQSLKKLTVVTQTLTAGGLAEAAQSLTRIATDAGTSYAVLGTFAARANIAVEANIRKDAEEFAAAALAAAQKLLDEARNALHRVLPGIF